MGLSWSGGLALRRWARAWAQTNHCGQEDGGQSNIGREPCPIYRQEVNVGSLLWVGEEEEGVVPYLYNTGRAE